MRDCRRNGEAEVERVHKRRREEERSVRVRHDEVGADSAQRKCPSPNSIGLRISCEAVIRGLWLISEQLTL